MRKWSNGINIMKAVVLTLGAQLRSFTLCVSALEYSQGESRGCRDKDGAHAQKGRWWKPVAAFRTAPRVGLGRGSGILGQSGCPEWSLWLFVSWLSE